MNIARTSHARYTYQYKITGYVALRCLKKTPTVLVEPEGGEDASVIFSADVVELQVKGEQADLDLAKLAIWLLHFPDRSATGTLLERVGPGNFALFVVAARAADDVRDFVVPLDSDIPALARSKYSRGTLQTMRQALVAAAASFGGDNLAGQRKAHITGVLDGMPDAELRERLSRVHVMEQLTDGRMGDLLPQHLVRMHRVPDACSSLAMADLVEAVTEARDKRDDLTPRVVEIVARYAPPLVYVSPSRVSRVQLEERVRASLDTNHVALLTGVAMSGKTDLARHACRERQDVGFECLETHSLPEAIRWLREPVVGARIALAHDPFGPTSLSSEADIAERALADFTCQMGPSRKLIVTARKNILQLLVTSKTLNTPSGTRLDWIDTTLKQGEEGGDIWRAHYTNASNEVLDSVARLLQMQRGDEVSQPGHINRLARLGFTLELDPSGLYRAGNESASHTAKLVLRSAEQSWVMVALYLGSGTDGCSASSLATCLTGQMEEGSLRPDRPGGFSVSLGGSIDEPVAPDPPSQIGLLERDRRAVLELETVGFVERRGEGRIRLAHPEYEVAAGLVLERFRVTESERVRDVTKAAIANLDPTVALRAIRALGMMNELVGQTLVDWLPELLLGCRSVFPEVADEAVSVLLKNFNEFSSAQRGEIIASVQKHRAASEWIFWSNGTAFYDTRSHRSYDMNFSTLDEGLVARLESEDAALRPHELFTVLKSGNRVKLSPSGRKRLWELGMASRLAVIRAKAARALARSPLENGELLLRAAADEHPVVLAGAVEGLLRGWETLELELQGKILEELRKGVLAPHAAAILDDVLLTYELAEVPAKEGRASWELWLEVAAMGLVELPNGRINTGRLYSFGKAAIQDASAEAVEKFLRAWLGWLLRTSQNSFPDEFALSVLELVPRDSDLLLTELACRMFSEGTTLLRAAAVRDLVDRWSDLTAELQQALEGELKNDGDGRWLRAIALTRQAVPEELHGVLLPKACSTSDAASFVACCPQQLLADALSVYCGHPQPLWWLGTHHSIRTTWEPVLSEVLSISTHPLWRLAVRETLLFRDAEADERLITMVEVLEYEPFNVLKSELLRISASNVGNSGGVLWAAVGARAVQLKLVDVVAGEIVDLVEAIDNCDNFDDVLSSQPLAEAIEQHLTADGMVLALAKRASEEVPATEHDGTTFLRLAQRAYRDGHPRLRRIHNHLCRALASIEGADAIIQEIRRDWTERRSKVVEEQRMLIDDHYELEDWVQP